MRGHVRAADPAADLVELGEPERVGALDDQRVRLRDVEARLDDRRRDEHVGVAAQERRASGPRARARVIWPCATSDAQAPGRAAGASRPPPRSSRPGCAGRRPGRRARARARARALISSSSYSPTCVRIGRRPSGGVSITEMSRRPASDMCSVRGIGVAVSASTSTSSRSARSSSFCATPKRCSSSTITSPRSFGITSRESTRCVPIRTSTLPSAKSASTCLHLGRLAEARDHLDPHREVAEALAEGVPVLLRRGSSSGRASAPACR